MTDQHVDRYLKAAAEGDIATVEDCLAVGVDIDAVNRQRQTAILLAATNQHYDLVERLIAAGADIDRQDQICLNPFLWGCISGNPELVRIMVEAGTDLERTTRFYGKGIHPASEKGHLGIVRYLTEETDINLNHTNLCGWTPLLEAILLRDGGSVQQQIVRLLVDNGADPTMVDELGVSPLAHAERLGFTEIADILRAALA